MDKVDKVIVKKEIVAYNRKVIMHYLQIEGDWIMANGDNITFDLEGTLFEVSIFGVTGEVSV